MDNFLAALMAKNGLYQRFQANVQLVLCQSTVSTVIESNPPKELRDLKSLKKPTLTTTFWTKMTNSIGYGAKAPVT